MSINNVTHGLASLRPIKAPEGIQPSGKTSPGTQSGPNFGEMLVDAVKEVEGLQQQADNKIEAVMTGKGGVTTHEAMIALEKADLAFQMMNQVRSKIMRAYEEVMRTAV